MSIRPFLIFFILLITCGIRVLQSQNSVTYSRADRHALETPKEYERTVNVLAEYLTSPFSTDEMKVRAIFRWVTQNIQYDVESYFSGQIKQMGTGDVLQSRSSVCDGYATLFEALADAAGFEAVKISGYAKGYGYQTKGRIADRPDHAWNAVKVNGEWKLLDCTWGAGEVDDRRRFKQSFNPYYFFTKPEEFIYDHLPEDQRWQLLRMPLSKKQFEDLPFARSMFFSLGMKEENGGGVINTGEELSITYSAPDNVLCMASLKKNGTEIPAATFVQREAGMIVLRCHPPAAGEYTLDVFAKDRTVPGSYSHAVMYKVIYRGTGSGGKAYPLSYGTFSESGAVLFSPREFGLAASDEQLFRIKAPGAAKVAVIIDKEWEYLESRNGLFEKRLEISSGKIQVAAKYSTNSSFEILLEFEGIGGHVRAEKAVKYAKYEATNAELMEPKIKRLQSGSVQNFRIKAPGALKAAVIVNEEWNFLTLRNGVFEGSVALGAGKVVLFAQYAVDEQFQGLVEFLSE